MKINHTPMSRKKGQKRNLKKHHHATTTPEHPTSITKSFHTTTKPRGKHHVTLQQPAQIHTHPTVHASQPHNAAAPQLFTQHRVFRRFQTQHFSMPLFHTSHAAFSTTAQRKGLTEAEILKDTSADFAKFQKVIEAEENLVKQGKAKDFFDLSDDDLSEDTEEMTDVENPVEYGQAFDQDNIKPDYFDPKEQEIEFMVAHFLQAEMSGTPIFPIYLRRTLFEKIMSTLWKIHNHLAKRGLHIDAEQVTTVIYDVFTNFAPELCRTHEHALNILFPMAPRVGDIVELPDVLGKCIVSKREYVDNRWNDDPDMEITDKERMMIITYDCLHQAMKGKSLRSNHPFDMQVYRLTLQQDERGLEVLMHQRGMIDMYTGRILNPQDDSVKQLQSDLKFDPKLLKGPGAKVLIQQRNAMIGKDNFNPDTLRLPGNNTNTAMIAGGGNNPLLLGEGENQSAQSLMKRNVDEFFHQNKPAEVPEELKHKFVLDSAADRYADGNNKDQYAADGQTMLFDQEQLQLEKQSRESMPSFHISPAEQQLRDEVSKGSKNLYHILDLYRQKKQIQQVYPQEVKKSQKEYLRPKVMTGEAAMVMYKSMMQDLVHSNKLSEEQKNMSERERYKKSLEVELAQQSQRNVIQDPTQLSVSGAKMTSKGAEYGPDALFFQTLAVPNAHNATGSTHNAPALPNRTLTIQEERELQREMNASIHSTSTTTTTGESKYMTKRREMQQLKREEVEKLQAEQAALPNMTTAERLKLEEEQKQRQQDEYEALLEEFRDVVNDLEQKHPNLNEEQIKALAEQEFQKRQYDAEELASKKFLKEMEEEGKIAYDNLDMKYKKKYYNIIIKTGPGAGLPDPLRIARGEDLFDIYPKANLALMEFLSDQWSAMVQEKKDHLEKQKALLLQYQDVKSRKNKKVCELTMLLQQQMSAGARRQMELRQDIAQDDDEEQRLREEWLTLGQAAQEDGVEEDENGEKKKKKNDNEDLEDVIANMDANTGLINNNRFELPYDVELTRYRLLATIAAAGDHAFTAEYIQDIFERVMKATNYQDLKQMVDDEVDQEFKAQQKQPHIAHRGDDNDDGTVVALVDKEMTKAQRLRQLTDALIVEEDKTQQMTADDLTSDGDFDLGDIEADIDSTLSSIRQKTEKNGAKGDGAGGGIDDDLKNIAFSKDEDLLSSESKGVKLTEDGYVKAGGKLYTVTEYAEVVWGKKPTPIEESPHIPEKMRNMIKSHYAHRDQLKEKREKQKMRQQMYQNEMDGQIVDNPEYVVQQQQQQQQQSQVCPHTGQMLSGQQQQQQQRRPGSKHPQMSQQEALAEIQRRKEQLIQSSRKKPTPKPNPMDRNGVKITPLRIEEQNPQHDYK